MNKQLLYNGASISYDIEGEGNAIVFLHGFLEDKSIWIDFAKRLSVFNKVICIDLPGFGKSGIISDCHSMELMAEAVNEVILKESIAQFAIIGHSMGGYVSLAYAEQLTDKLSSLVLFHSQAVSDDNQAKKNRDRTIDIVRKNHSNYISAFIPTLFAEQNVDKFPDEIEILTQTSLRTDNQGIIAALSGMRDRKDYCNLLKSIHIPVLFIAGKLDSKIPLEKINLQLTLPSISEALILDNVGHMGFIEAKENTFATIKNFVHKYQLA